jgi:hypothetical protein
MARCAFEADARDPALKTCSHCGRVLRSPHPPEKCHAVCRAFPPEPAAAPPRKSLLTQFVRAWWRYLRAGAPRVTTAERRQRLAICQTCPHYQSRGALSTCRACGCFARLKARWQTEHCPLSKWPGDPPAPGRLPCGCGNPAH